MRPSKISVGVDGDGWIHVQGIYPAHLQQYEHDFKWEMGWGMGREGIFFLHLGDMRPAWYVLDKAKGVEILGYLLGKGGYVADTLLPNTIPDEWERGFISVLPPLHSERVTFDEGSIAALTGMKAFLEASA